jgi:hypothetical protein
MVERTSQQALDDERSLAWGEICKGAKDSDELTKTLLLSNHVGVLQRPRPEPQRGNKLNIGRSKDVFKAVQGRAYRNKVALYRHHVTRR